jgi:hypothetical protein
MINFYRPSNNFTYVVVRVSLYEYLRRHFYMMASRRRT